MVYVYSVSSLVSLSVDRTHKKQKALSALLLHHLLHVILFVLGSCAWLGGSVARLLLVSSFAAQVDLISGTSGPFISTSGCIAPIVPPAASEHTAGGTAATAGAAGAAGVSRGYRDR
ncbi:hypothetical protein BDW67DRAFT_151549 [Aspergillus spinulosporus]